MEVPEKRRWYRGLVRTGNLMGFPVVVEQTDLWIRAETDLTAQAYELVREARSRIWSWAEAHPEFLTSLIPLPISDLAPTPVREMLIAARQANVGPMAAVAGAMADYVGRRLMPLSPRGLIVENGGDIFLSGPAEVVVGLFAGNSPLSMKLGLAIEAKDLPSGICTSSASIGHSISFGRTDAATVFGDTAALADAAATALGNRVNRREDIEPALELVMSIPGVRGAVVIIGQHLGVQGDVNLVPLGP